ncbi:PGF-pre-PGF domain-containing protein [Candidatus Woesearchaeota archaeon]|nr:PGF-pre-PGF domain-containing protein [Candidatus Woesearchaeota archaeon]
MSRRGTKKSKQRHINRQRPEAPHELLFLSIAIITAIVAYTVIVVAFSNINGTTSTLTISDNGPIVSGETAVFSADYNDISTGESLSGATCRFIIRGQVHIMSETASEYVYETVFFSPANYDYDIVCYKSGYEALQTTDSIIVEQSYQPTTTTSQTQSAQVQVPDRVPTTTPAYSKFRGRTTRFDSMSKTQLEKAQNVILEDTTHGGIEFLEELDLTNANLDKHIVIKKGFIGVNSKADKRLNKRARITFYGIDLQDPKIYRDGIECADCQLVSRAGTTISYQVPGFSNYTVSSCSQTDVQAAIDNATDGDTIIIPAGSCTWNSNVIIDKTITIQGSGIDVTTIIDNNAGTVALFDCNMGLDERVTISDMTIEAGASQSHQRGVIYIHGAAQDFMKFRVHNIKFNAMRSYPLRINDVYGLIDNNEFYDMQFGVVSVFVEGDRDAAFSRPALVGGQWGVFVEDNVFDNTVAGSAWLEVWDAARIIARHNTFQNTWISTHGYEDVGANYRGPILLEYYENIADCDSSCYAAIKYRGGTGAIFNNTWTETGSGSWSGGSDHGINLVYYGLNNAGDNACGSTSHSWTTRCLTYPCIDQPGYVGTTQNPVYIWNNVQPSNFVNVYNLFAGDDGYDCNTVPKVYNNAAQCSAGIDSNVCFIQEGRDYYLSQKPGYTPYTYPHPLRTGQTTPSPMWSPPTNAWPDDRDGDWSNNVGVVAGIPDYDQGASVSSGASAAQIQICLDNLDVGEYCYMNAGSYNLGSTTINIPAGRELKGAGMGAVTVTYTGTGSSFTMGSGSYSGSWTSISTVNKGDTKITVTGGAGSLNDGDMILLSGREDNNLVDKDGWYSGGCSWCGDDDGVHLVGQFVELSNKVPNGANWDFDISRPAYFTYDNSPEVQEFTLSSRSGISDLKIVYTSSSASQQNGAVNFKLTQKSWAKNIEVYNARTHMFLSYSHGNIITGCYLHESASGYSSGNGYTLWVFLSNSDHYIYDNMIEKGRYNINFEGGGSGLVIAYNFLNNPRNSDWDGLLHEGIGLHGAHPTMNLYEGNIVNTIFPDNTWGSSSHGMVFRNWINREHLIDWGVLNVGYGRNSLNIQATSTYWSIVGNVLGFPEMDGVYQYTPAQEPDCYSDSSPSAISWGSNSASSGNDCVNAPYATRYVHQNYDYVNNGIFNDSSSSGDNTNLPTSLYLSSKPDWWCQETPWPAIGPDVSGYINDLPAKIRYDGDICTLGAACSIPADCPDNGNFCDGTETCSAGACISTGNPCSDDGYSCTTTCNEPTDSCNVPNNGLCDDSNVCTTDSCIGAGGDANGCSYSFNTNSCSDGVSCTQSDTCGGGVCGGIPNDNLCLPLPSGCSIGSCDINQGCVFLPSGCDVGSGLVAWLKFDDGSGSAAIDSSSNNNDGTVNGPAWASGIIDGAINAIGDADYVEISTTNVDANQGTIATWVWANSFAAADENFIFGHTTYPVYGSRIQIYTDDPGGNLDLGLGDNHALDTGIYNLDLDTWYHIALTWDGTNYEVYVDGNLETSGTYTGLTSINSFADVANNGNTGTRDEAWNGLIDDFRIYNRVLSQAEIQTLEGAPPSCADVDGDTYGVGCATGPDCDDTNASINPAATEICGNSVDEDCNLGLDNGCGGVCDTDSDGHDEEGILFTWCTLLTGQPQDDCDDDNAAVNPSMTEICENSLDDDCTGGDAICPPTGPVCSNEIIEAGEACDGSDVNGYTCSDFPGYASGNLACQNDCKAYDVSSCNAGSTVQATGCSQSEVQTAINLAIDGDTVLVPEGNCVWNNPISLTNKAVVLQGAGIDKTNITDDVSGTMISSSSSTKPMRVTRFTFKSGANADANGVIFIGGSSTNWRVDNNKFLNINYRGIWVDGETYGLIDNNLFVGTTSFQGILVGLSDGNLAWSQEVNLGNKDAVIIENNVFSFSNLWEGRVAVDGDDGARLVIRNNNLTNIILTVHGACSSERAAMSYEIYNNKIELNNGNSASRAIFLRGGTGVIYNNKFTGSITRPIGPTNYRTCDGVGANCGFSYDRCDGDSVFDGNQDSTGWPCLDQIGRTTDQASMPLYEWNNTYNSADTDIYPVNSWGCSNPQPLDHIQEDRDYFNDLEKPDYTAYVYPHPLAVEPDPTIQADSCSFADVQTAINNTNPGDTVLIPAGSCDWGGTNGITISKQDITIQGAGASNTIIYNNNDYAFLFSGTSGSGARITQIGFNDCSPCIKFTGTNSAKDFRIDHCKFTDSYGIQTLGTVRGVADHNEFYDSYAFYLFADGNSAQTYPLVVGDAMSSTTNVIFIEDNLFEVSGSGCVAHTFVGNLAARAVIRYNTIDYRPTTCWDALDAHDSNENYPSRGTLGYEIYKNKFYFASGAARTMHLRGGQHMVYDNYFNVGMNNAIRITSYTYHARPERCTGNPYDVDDASGSSCPDQINHAYFWGNKDNCGSDMDNCVGGNTESVDNLASAVLIENTHYFQCSTKQECINDYGLSYNPYTYPHPLVTGSPPPLVEVCDNSVDDDGDTLIDCADSECTSAPNCQVPCTLTDASWSVTSATQYDTVSLTVTGDSGCNGKTLSFETFENDSVFDDPANFNPGNAVFNSGGIATTSWVAEWQSDGIGDPEYYFIATQTDNLSNYIYSNNELSVSEAVVDLSTGLFAHWAFDESSGSTASDSSGNSNDGTVYGALWASGTINNALNFDGLNDYVEVGALDITGSALTISAWFKSDNLASCGSSDCRIISKSISTAEADHYWMISTIASSGVKLRFRLKTSGTTSTLIATSGNLVNNQWYHGVAVYDGNFMKLYLDGVEVGSIAKTGVIDTNNLVNANIGRNPDGSVPFDGLIDDVRVYNRVLTTTEINALFALGGGIPPPPSGSVINASSCSQLDVQAAINSASDGDTVNVPAGNCTWTTLSGNTPAVQISNKGIILQGAGIDVTIINDETGTLSNQYPLEISNSNNVRITGFTFRGMKKRSATEPGLVIGGNSFNWRVDNNKFDSTGTNGRGMWARGEGVIDHNVFVNTYQGVAVKGLGNASWDEPFTPGTEHAVYVEDNIFNYASPYDGALDSYNGGRYVFRHNIVNGTRIGHHGADSGDYRSTHTYEIYENTFSTINSQRFMFFRGGTGVVFNNTANGNYNTKLEVTNYCTCAAESSCPISRQCNNYPCQDQIGRTTDHDLNGTQDQEPLYEWNNVLNGADVDISVSNAYAGCINPQPSDHIKENRDYYNDLEKPDYVPYIYPHPLVTGTPPPSGNIHYVMDGASGDGSDWNNAYGSLPATLQRGHTYYIADGNYSSYTFDAVEQGSEYITIKKAIETDHGTSDGWLSTYGDGVADWTRWTITTSYWEFDGQVGQWADSMYGVPALPNYVPYGFRILLNTASTGAKVIRIGAFGNTVNNINLRHLEMGFSNAPGVSSAWADSQDIVYAAASNLICSYCWIHDAGRVNWFPLAALDDVVVEYSVLERNGQAVAAGFGSQHSELYSADGGSNHVFRYNIIRDWRSTGGLILHDDNGNPPHFTNWQAYGNVFTTTGYFLGSTGDSNGVLNSLSDGVSNSAYVYNNAFVDIDYGCSILSFGGYAAREIYNNIFYNCRRFGGNTYADIGGTTHDYNWFYNSGAQSETNIEYGLGNPFIDSANGDFRLNAATNAGSTLGVPYNIDPDGNIRGSDGVWDRGAYEFDSGVDPCSSGANYKQLNATTLQACSCDYADVSAAVTAANPEDTVNVPAGTCTWSNSITIGNDVTLQGAGIGNTLISGNGANLNDNSRLTGFEFSTDVDIAVTQGADNWRIDHNKVEQSGSQGVWLSMSILCDSDPVYMTGLIDNNEIINARILTNGCSDNEYSGALWYTTYRDYDFDSEKIFIENNTITMSSTTGVVDGNNGGRFVVRFNTITDGYFEAHGARDRRGFQSWEIYRNNLIMTQTGSPMAANLRGGSGVIFDNNCNGTIDYCDWTISTERCISSYPSYTYSTRCDGVSQWDTYSHPGSGIDFMCFDATGAGRDTQLSAGVIDQPPYDQEYNPAYMWGNTRNTINPWEFRVSYCSDKIIEDRDYFLDDSSNIGFGNGGVSSGLWTNRPVCDITKQNQGYWAIDMGSDWNAEGTDGALYVCDGVNTWNLRYTPTSYPHPLRTGGAPPPPVEICDNSVDDDGDSLVDCLDSDCSSHPSCTGSNFLPDQIVEAEDGVLTSPVSVGNDAGASGGQYITTSIDDSGVASYTFDISTENDYYIQARILADSQGTNSYYAGLSTENPANDNTYTWDLAETTVWALDNVTNRGDIADPKVWHLTVGTHTFEVHGREQGTWLDTIQLLTAPSCTDVDGDTYGVGCVAGPDCDDTNASINPSASEVCGNSVDEDCDTILNNGCGGVCDTDNDNHDQEGILFAWCTLLTGQPQDDCDDNNANVNPSMTEICENGLDDDCSGSDATCPPCTDIDGDTVCDSSDSCIGENFANMPSDGTCYYYTFNYGTGCHQQNNNASGTQVALIDCDYLDTVCQDYNDVYDVCDGSGGITSGTCNDYTNDDGSTVCTTTSETHLGCDNEGINNYDVLNITGFYDIYCGISTGNCDGSNISTGAGAIVIDNCNATEYCTVGIDTCILDIDLDDDGFNNTVDCNDNNSSINPGAIEVCDSGVDENCDTIFETCSTCEDVDGDGYFNLNGCNNLTADCNDNNVSINPNATEIIYNGINEDCNITTFDDDLDQDGYNASDECDDYNGLINPSRTEICGNTVDEDCSGTANSCPPPGGGGGGSSGGGSAYTPPVELTNITHLFTYANVVSRVVTELKSTTQTGLELGENATVSAATLPENLVYEYFTLTPDFTSNQLETVVIEYRISKTWVDDNNVIESSIDLEHYNGVEWVDTPSNLKNSDSEYNYYTASTNELGDFAITGDRESILGFETVDTIQNIVEDLSDLPQNVEPRALIPSLFQLILKWALILFAVLISAGSLIILYNEIAMIKTSKELGEALFKKPVLIVEKHNEALKLFEDYDYKQKLGITVIPHPELKYNLEINDESGSNVIHPKQITTLTKAILGFKGIIYLEGLDIIIDSTSLAEAKQLVQTLVNNKKPVLITVNHHDLRHDEINELETVITTFKHPKIRIKNLLKHVHASIFTQSNPRDTHHQRIVSYIQKCHSAGISDDRISQKLLSVGWDKKTLTKAYNQLII